jgi:hypothetical protein
VAWKIRTRIVMGLAVLIATFSPVIVSSVIAPTPAAAAIATCGTLGFYFDGPYTQTTATEGTSGVMVNRYGATCTTDTSVNNFVGSWTMFQGTADGTCSGMQYAQSGEYRIYGSLSYLFAQYNDCGTPTTKIGSAITYGTSNQDWEQYLPSCSCESLNIDVHQFLTTSFNPLTAWTYPFRNEWLGETHYTASDIPGNPSVGYTTYTTMQVQQQTSNTWTNTLPTISYFNDNSARWTHDTVVSHPVIGNTVDIWTYSGY